MKKNVLITGTSTGVGLETALVFAKQGYKVYATMRNLDKSNTLKQKIKEENLDIEILELDVTKQETISKTVEYIITKDKKIDILINNAGAGFAKTLEQASTEEIEWVNNVNYLGVVYATKAVLPYMRKQKAGRIITVSSVGGLIGQPFNELYCAAKFAVEGFIEALATYVGPSFNIKFSVVEPGGISTEFMKSAISNTAINGQFATGEYEPIFAKYLEGNQRRANEEAENTYQTPLEVATVIASIAENEHPPLRKRTSKWAEEFTKLKTALDPDGLKQIQQITKTFL
ncbi:SDR family oxidoreductase [Cellulophaga omnivescoria]|uniref:SDR family oxidoreductase n=1 Tax=Cellulophaga omnivescoria TaxID=1888890 RepID=UPI0009864538|nr:SDR family oxidoreductase [Cellulophaga omnivescoria]WBU90767.1 SDR family oxidoreductase [Cellulophaga omnivescoria]